MTHLYRTQTTGNRRTFTISCWIKFTGKTGSSGAIILNTDGTNTNQNFMYQLTTGATLRLHLYGGDAFTTTRKLVDNSGWYHIVLGIDTTQASAGDRVKLYVNGELQSITQASLYPAQNFDFGVGDNGRVMSIMGDHDNSNNYDNKSYLSHYHFCDGYQYAASDFGSTDAVTGEWNINTAPNVNYCSTGFFLKFEDSSNLTLDSGGNNISFSTSGTPIATKDNASNNFCTLNNRARFGGNLSLSNGNTTANETAGAWQMASSTLGASSGKYYFEYKITTLGTGSGYHKIGFISTDNGYQNTGHLAEPALDGGYAFYCQNGNLEVRTDNAVISGYEISTLGVSFSNNDIMCLAIDMDNKKAYFRKNGDAWIKSADPANGTNGLDISADYPSGSTKGMIPAIAIYANGAGSVNFGNGYFGTTAVSSAGTNASGNGIFEYDVPTGYTALSTKGLNL